MQRLHNTVILVLLLALLQGCGGVSKDDSDDGDNGDNGTPPDVGPFPPISRIVEVENGLLEGERIDGTGILQFLGIPYATPPLGDLRWREPEPALSWTGIRDATTAQLPCIQGDTLDVSQQSEDCLYLNIAAPEEESDYHRPVMVWFHGEDDDNGGATRAPTDIVALAEATGHVVVSVGARLGFLGFLALPELQVENANNSTGNYRHLDEVRALNWIQNNIRAFNGSPNNITLFGQYGGANSVCRHLSSPISASLFHRAILQSGRCGPAVTDTLLVRYQQGENFKGIWGCSTASAPLDCMRQQDAFAMRDSLKNAGKADDLLHGGFLDEAQQAFLPVAAIDDYAFFATPYEALAESPANIDIMIGVTRNQFTLFLQNETNIMPTTLSEYQEAVRTALPPTADIANLTLILYPVDAYASYADAYADLLGDYFFSCPAIATADVLASVGHAVRFYQFNREINNEPFQLLLQPIGLNAPDMGVIHRAELPYLWNEVDQQVGTAPLLTVEALWQYWGSFASTGVPSAVDRAEWPLYTTAAGDYLGIGVLIEADSAYKLDKCDYFNVSLGL